MHIRNGFAIIRPRQFSDFSVVTLSARPKPEKFRLQEPGMKHHAAQACSFPRVLQGLSQGLGRPWSENAPFLFPRTNPRATRNEKPPDSLSVKTTRAQRRVMKKFNIVVGGVVASMIGFADMVLVNDSPTIVRNAEMREAIRQDSTWTSENIQRNPYLFLQDQIATCDRLRAKIEAQNITLIRMGKQADRKVEDAEGLIVRYNKFLGDAKKAYKAAEKNKSWPVSLNGYDLNEEELSDKIADALERVEFARKEKKDNQVISKKVEIRKSVLKTKKRELTALRRKLVQQAEQVKMNAALTEIGELNNVLGTIKDMMIEIDEDPTKLSLGDLTADDPNAKRNKAVEAFLKD